MTQKTQKDNQTLQSSKPLTSTQGSAESTSTSVLARFKSDTTAETTAHPEYNPKQDIQSLILVNNQRQKPTYTVVISDARPGDQTALSRGNVTRSTTPPQGKLGKSKDVSHIQKPSHTPLPPLVPAGWTSPPNNPSNALADAARLSPEKQTVRQEVGGGGTHVRRSWSVVAQSGLPPQSIAALSQRFHQTVAEHGLHLRQRVRWLIGQHNWLSSGDMEQVSHYYSY